MDLQEAEKMEIALRIPSWSEKSTVTVNCVPVASVVLARDERLEGPGLEAILAPVEEENERIDLTLKHHLDRNIWMVFSVKFIPELYAEFGADPVETELCDYASAGNTGNGYPFFKVWMPQLVDPRK